ncbi:MAG: transposase [Lactobacillus sp.]
MTEAESKEIIKSLTTTINNLNEEIALLREQVAYLTQQRYGKSSEKMPLSGQISLFEESGKNEDDDLPRRRPRRDYYL